MVFGGAVLGFLRNANFRGMFRKDSFYRAHNQVAATLGSDTALFRYCPRPASQRGGAIMATQPLSQEDVPSQATQTQMTQLTDADSLTQMSQVGCLAGVLVSPVAPHSLANQFTHRNVDNVRIFWFVTSLVCVVIFTARSVVLGCGGSRRRL